MCAGRGGQLSGRLLGFLARLWLGFWNQNRHAARLFRHALVLPFHAASVFLYVLSVIAEFSLLAQSMVLQALTVNVRISGYRSSTLLELTFYNPHDKVLEGNLEVPLPEGAVVTGYGAHLLSSLLCFVDSYLVQRLFRSFV
jgi:hypothetical protein